MKSKLIILLIAFFSFSLIPIVNANTPPSINSSLIGAEIKADGSLVAYYPFESASADDMSGEGNDGVNNGATYTEEGRVGGGMSFDGDNDYVEIPDSSSLDITNAITISAWIKADTFGASPGNPIFNKWYDGSKRAYYFNALTGGEILVGIAVSDGNSAQVEGSTTNLNMNTGQWYHVAMVWSTALGEVKVYKDGNYIESIGSGATNVMYANNMNPRIGRDYSTRYFDGAIDEVVIYNRSLSASEIAEIFAFNRTRTTQYLGASPNSTSDADNDNVTYAFRWYNTTGIVAETVHFDNKSLVAYYPFDYDVRDYAGSNDGSLVADAYINISESYFKQGIGSLWLDGNSDYITLPSLNFNAQTVMTLSAWIKTSSAVAQRIISFDDGTNFVQVFIAIDDNGRARVFARGAADEGTGFALVNVDDNNWHHIVGIINEVAGDVELFVDGISRGSASHGSAFTKVTLISNVIGRFDDGAIQYFNGEIDSVAIWNRSLSADEIRKLYDAGAGNILNSSLTSGGDYLVQITPVDFDDWGVPVNSSTLTILEKPPTTFRNWLNFKNGVTKVRHWIMTHSDNDKIRRWRMK